MQTQPNDQTLPPDNRGDFFNKGKKMKHGIIKLLALTGALLSTTAKAEEKQAPKPGITVFAASEQDGLKKNYTEITLKPDITCQKGEYKLGYYGSFCRAKETTGTEIDWMTLASKIRAENNDWTLEIGRSCTREYAGYLYAPTTTSFDNQGMIKGTSRIYTGTSLTHKETGLTLGQVASDTRMTPTHWDSTLVGWGKEVNNEWAIHLQTTGNRKTLSTLGATVKWQPTKETAVVAEGLYWNKETTGILTANNKLTDDLTLFAGAQMTSPQRGKPEGLATMGANYNLGKGFQLVMAAQQKLGTDRATSALLGIKYAGDFR